MKFTEPDFPLLQSAVAKLRAERYVEAFRDFQKLESIGSIQAMYYLGYAHQRGLGCPRDRELAKEHYLKAAKMGYRPCQFNLADILYHEGNFEDAKEWYAAAAEQGDTDACYGIYKIYQNGHYQSMHFDEAIEYLEKGAKGKNPFAMHELFVSKLKRKFGPLQRVIAIISWPIVHIKICIRMHQRVNSGRYDIDNLMANSKIMNTLGCIATYLHLDKTVW